MEITYKGQSIYFGESGSRLTILLNAKTFLVAWGRNWREKGNLPHVASLPDELLQAGLLEQFKTERVPILADSYTFNNGDGFSNEVKLKPRGVVCQDLPQWLCNQRSYVFLTRLNSRLRSYGETVVDRPAALMA